MISTILYILFIIIIGIGVLLLFANNTKTGKKSGKVQIFSEIIIALGIIFVAIVPGSFHQVEAGKVAVVKTLGKVSGMRFPGTHFDFYLTNDYTFFDTTVQKLDIKTASYSSDAQTMEIQMTIQYKIDATKAEQILTEYMNMTSLAQRIEKVADDNTKSILSKYSAMKIIETRASISPEVEKVIKEAVGDRYYVTVTAVNLTNIDFTPEFEKSVEDKVIAEQQKEAAITKAEQELEVSKLAAKSKIEAARGDAESQKIIASAFAEATALKIVELARSLGYTIKETEVVSEVDGSISYQYSIEYDETHTKDGLGIVVEFVKYLEYLEKWDGKLPSVITGDSGLDILLPSNVEK